MSDAESEYSIRGRELLNGDPLGAITTTKFYFGDAENEIDDHVIFRMSFGMGAHGVDEVPKGADPTKFKNSFGLKHPIGNVWSRSADGVVRGGGFDNCGSLYANSSYSIEGYVKVRQDLFGFRLVEDIPNP